VACETTYVFLRFLNVFFKIQKHDFLRYFEWLTTYSRTLISRKDKATDFKFGQYIHRVHRNKSPLKILQKESGGVWRECPNFLCTPYYLRNGQSYELQILYAYS